VVRRSATEVTVAMSIKDDLHIAPAYGVMSSIVQIELGARILVPHQDDTVDVRFVTCGRLRCSATAAMHLRNALDASLKMLEQPAPNPVGASKLN
jgi:hypothetical protein